MNNHGGTMVGMRMVSVVMWLCKIINYSYLWCQTAQCFTYHSSHQDALCTWHDCMKLIQLQMKTPSKYSEGVLLCRTYDILHQQQTRTHILMAFINAQTVYKSITNWFVGCFGASESNWTLILPHLWWGFKISATKISFLGSKPNISSSSNNILLLW
jgi:hypothetical protein